MDSKIAVAIVSPEWSSLGGAGGCARDLSKMLAQCDDRVELWHAWTNVTKSRPDELAGFKYGLRIRPRLIRLWNLQRELRQHSVQVAVINTTVQATAVIAAKMAGCKIIWWCHESGTAMQPTAMRLRRRIYELLALQVVAPSSAVTVGDLPIRVIPNVIREMKHGDSTRESKGKRRVLVLGTKSWIKGTDRLPSICIAVRMQVECEFWVVGPIDQRDVDLVERSRTELADALGDDLTWRGPVDDPSDILGSADLLLLPSRTDTRPRVAEEALMSGVPVAARDLPGLHDIRSISCAGSVELGETDQDLARAVLKLLDGSFDGSSLLADPPSENNVRSHWLCLLAQVAGDANG